MSNQTKGKMVVAPYIIYEEMEKDGLTPHTFKQEARFPEISQAFLKNSPCKID